MYSYQDLLLLPPIVPNDPVLAWSLPPAFPNLEVPPFDNIYKFMDTIQTTFFTKMDDLMHKIKCIHNRLSDLEDKLQQACSDIQHLHTLHQSHQTDPPQVTSRSSTESLMDYDSVPLNLNPLQD